MLHMKFYNPYRVIVEATPKRVELAEFTQFDDYANANPDELHHASGWGERAQWDAHEEVKSHTKYQPAVGYCETSGSQYPLNHGRVGADELEWRGYIIRELQEDMQFAREKGLTLSAQWWVDQAAKFGAEGYRAGIDEAYGKGYDEAIAAMQRIEGEVRDEWRAMRLTARLRSFCGKLRELWRDGAVM